MAKTKTSSLTDSRSNSPFEPSTNGAARTNSSSGDEKATRWTIQRGSATVKIYLTPHGAEKYYTTSCWVDGKRKRQVFPTLQAAKDEAAIIAAQLTKGDMGSAELSNADRAAFQRAKVLLEPSGAALEFAASEYASAIKRLGAVSLSQAVDFYLKRHPVHLAPKMVREVVDEMLEAKRADRLSARYVQQLKYDMNRLLERFQGRIGNVAGVEIDGWLRELKVAPRTRNNLRGSIQALFSYAIARKYLPKDHDELDAVALVKDGGGEIEIFTPDEIREILAVAMPTMVPFLALGAFAGVRHAEVLRLDWANVQLKAGIIEIKAGAAKTASRRVIPILPNLGKWLKEFWRESGKVCPYVNVGDELVEITRRVNAAREKCAAKRGTKSATFKWKHNALRHSFISYRVAQIQNVAQVALEAGNSPAMIFKHYRELVRPAEAKAWFGIVPKG